jgi:hypothetical protein
LGGDAVIRQWEFQRHGNKTDLHGNLLRQGSSYPQGLPEKAPDIALDSGPGHI